MGKRTVFETTKERGSEIVVVTKKLRDMIKGHAEGPETVDETLRRLLKPAGFKEESFEGDAGRQLLGTDKVTTIRLTPMLKRWIHERMGPGETVDHAIRRLARLGRWPKRSGHEREGTTDGTGR